MRRRSRAELREKLGLRNGRVVRVFDPWGSPLCTCPPKYSLQPYTGCSHFCLYCYATAYIGLRKSTPKKNFMKRLLHDIRHVIDPRYHIDMSTSSDPYPPEEAEYRLTRKALEAMVPHGLKILIITKGSLVARDVDIISRGNVAVTMTITTLDKSIASRLEPGAPSPGERIHALRLLKERGVPVGVRVDPIIPGINDDQYMVRELLEAVRDAGAVFIVTSTYKARPDNLKRMIRGFPELENMLRNIYLEEGRWMYGYWYAPFKLRKKLMEMVKNEADRLGLQFATCREGMVHLHTAKTCDGSHLIPLRIRPLTSTKQSTLHRFSQGSTREEVSYTTEHPKG